MLLYKKASHGFAQRRPKAGKSGSAHKRQLFSDTMKYTALASSYGLAGLAFEKSYKLDLSE
jgi:hypothetical protein